MNPKLKVAALALVSEASESVEYSDWPELQKAIANVHEAVNIGDVPLREALHQTAHHLREITRGEGKGPGPNYFSTGNLYWMMDTVLANIETFPTDKISRWIGFVQGVLGMKDLLVIDDERDRTRPFFQAAYKEMGIKIPEVKDAS